MPISLTVILYNFDAKYVFSYFDVQLWLYNLSLQFSSRRDLSFYIRYLPTTLVSILDLCPLLSGLQAPPDWLVDWDDGGGASDNGHVCSSRAGQTGRQCRRPRPSAEPAPMTHRPRPRPRPRCLSVRLVSGRRSELWPPPPPPPGATRVRAAARGGDVPTGRPSHWRRPSVNCRRSVPVTAPTLRHGGSMSPFMAWQTSADGYRCPVKNTRTDKTKSGSVRGRGRYTCRGTAASGWAVARSAAETSPIYFQDPPPIAGSI